MLHRAAFDGALWPAATSLIEEAAGFRKNALLVGEGVDDDARLNFASFLERGNRRDDLGREYLEFYYPHDEKVARVRRLPLGRLVHTPDLYSEEERETSPTYNESLPRSGSRNGLVVRLDGLEGLRIAWTLGDPVATSGWGFGQLELINALLPHVRHFVGVRQVLAGVEAMNAGMAELFENGGIGVLQLDRGGRVLAANATAMDVLRNGEGLSDCGGILHASLPADNSRLQRLLKRALPVFGNAMPPSGGSMMVYCPSRSSQLELRVHPLDVAGPDFGGRRVAVLVLVADPRSRRSIDPSRVSALLGLTASESRVSALLAEGRSVREIAATTGLQENYVRWVLKQVYKKLGLSGQVALVLRVLAVHTLPRR